MLMQYSKIPSLYIIYTFFILQSIFDKLCIKNNIIIRYKSYTLKKNITYMKKCKH